MNKNAKIYVASLAGLVDSTLVRVFENNDCQ